MVPTARRLLLGPDGRTFQRSLDLLFVLVLFAATFGAYALGFFEVTGGVVFLPGDAAVVGLLGAGLLGYRRSGLVFAWFAASAPLLGYHADHAFLGLSYRSLVDRLAYFVEPDGLVYLGIEGIVLGTLGFAVGTLVGRGVEALRSEPALGQSG